MTQTISLNHITKIEGHANLLVEIKDNNIVKCELSSVEGSRYFEGILKGKMYFEAHEIASRICGICSCAHTVAAVNAVEKALNIRTSKQTDDLKKLLTLGERIRSHATHLYFFSLPDYMGYESALAMLPKYKEEILRALRLIKTGNEVVKVVGGRDLHPVSLTVGGFLKVPTKEQIDELASKLEECKKDAIETAGLFMKLDNREYHNPCEYFSICDKTEYPLFKGPLVAPGVSFDDEHYLDYFKEYHSPYSTANFVVNEGKSYMVGAISRMNNNFGMLSDDAKKVVADSGIRFPSDNPFLNNFAQAVELVHSLDHAIAICKGLNPTKEELVRPQTIPEECRGIEAIEVPRGILFHDYTIGKDGKIVHANIITPTAQNLKNMEDNIRRFLPSLLELKEEQINIEVEKLIRAYDPCFSCSTHFLTVKWKKH